MDFEIEHGAGYDYGCADNTALYEMMARQFLAEAASGVCAPADDPHLLWLLLEAARRGDTRLPWPEHRTALAANRWLPLLYELDEVPGIDSGGFDAEYRTDLLGRPGPLGCRHRIIALLTVLDGPGAAQNFDIDALVAELRRASGGYDPFAVGRAALLTLVEQHRVGGR